MAETLSLRGLRAPVEISRDAHGVPLVRATSQEDAAFALGFLHAIDRPLQLVLQLAACEGRLSERVADRPELRALDRGIKRLGLPQHGRSQVAKLGPLARARIEAYAAGVNAARGRRRPPEMILLRAELPIYQAHHAMGMLLLMGYAGLADGQRFVEKFIVEALQRGVPEAGLREIFAPHLDGMDADLLRGVKLVSSVLGDVPPPLPALPRAAASNNWVVAPERSATGRAIVANDPHLEVNRLPQLLYEAQLWISDDEWAHGASIPGLPGIVFGRNARVAWGITYGTADACDFFVERCDGQGHYLRDGQWKPLDVRREVVAGQETIETWSTEHGMLEGPAGTQEGDYLAWRWSGFETAAASLEAFMGLMLSRSVEEARAHLGALGVPCLNMVLADVDGDCGYQYGGAIPRRRAGWSGLYPVEGWRGENDWRGFLPPSALPARRKAELANGVWVTANNRPDPEGGVSTIPTAPYRHDRIRELLAGERKLTVGDCEHTQYDVLSLQARRLLPHLLPHIPDGEVKQALSRWDFRYDAALREPTMFENIYLDVIRAVFCDGPHGSWLERVLLDTSLLTVIFGNLDEVLVREDSVWLPREKRAEVLARGCVRGAARMAPPWGQVHSLLLQHLVFGGNEVARRLRLDRGPFPWDGGRATVRQASMFYDGDRLTTFAACYHYVTQLGGTSSFTNTPAGVSERPWSRHYADDLERWLRGEYKEMRMGDPSARMVLNLFPA
jgi:penicillin amidase